MHLYETKRPPEAKLAALDPLGEQFTSPEIANRISQWRDAGIGAAFFAIGGADGHSRALLDKADLTLSFGVTGLICYFAMLAEQLCRAKPSLQSPHHKL